MNKLIKKPILATIFLFTFTIIFAFQFSKSVTDNFPNEIKLPTGFSATILATELGATRHITISKKGDIYAKLSKLKDGKGIVVLKDNNKDGKIDKTEYFGDFTGTEAEMQK